MKKKLEPGSIQRQWLKNLKEHPERQMKQQLAKRDRNDEYHACCLGEYLIYYNRIKSHKKIWIDNEIYDGESTGFLNSSWKKLGLNGMKGELLRPCEKYSSLSSMNDYGMTWSEISEYVEQNFENVFTKSI